jgi:hypothetical protein
MMRHDIASLRERLAEQPLISEAALDDVVAVYGRALRAGC